MAEQQLVRRRVFTDSNELLREGMAPKDVPNTRSALMAYWAEQDRIEAERDATEAEAAAAALAEPAELEAPDLTPAIEALQQQVAELEERLQVVDQLELASPESIAACAMAAAMAAGSAEATITAGQRAREELQATANAAADRLSALEGEVGQTAAAVGELLADTRRDHERREAERDAKLAKSISKRIAGLEAQAATMRGPRGPQGRIGQGLIAGSGRRPEKRPDTTDWAPGDSWLDTSAEGFQLSYMDASGKWSEPTRVVPAPKLINATANVLDMSTHTIAPVINSGAGGGGTGSGERLLSNRLSTSGSTVLADSSNWAGVSDPLSGTIELELRALDGSFAAQSSVCVASFTWEAGGDQWSEYALIGGMRDTFRVDLSVQRSPAMAPSSYTGTLPPGSSRLVVFAQVSLVSGAADGGTTRFSLAGSVEFNHEGKGVIYTPGSTPPQPLWVWG